MDAPPVTPAVDSAPHPPFLTRRQLVADWFDRTLAAALAAGLVALACAPLAASRVSDPSPPGAAHSTERTALAKITFPLDAIDADGLTGPPDGKVAVSYEFCIPDDPEKIAEVRAIDRSVEVMRGSPGRVGCGPGTVLCVGSTLRREWRESLLGLAALPYVSCVSRVDFD